MGSRLRRNQGGTAATSSREAALSAPVGASKLAWERDDAATPGPTKPAASAQTTPARMQAGGSSQQPVSSLRRSRRPPWEGTLTKEAARRMGLPTEGLPTTDELRAQEDSALQQALAESVAAAGSVIAQAPAGPSSGPELAPEAAPGTEAAPEPEAAPAMSDEPAGGEAGALAAAGPAAAPKDAEAVPPQLGGAEPAKRAKRARVGLKELQSLHEDGLELVGSRSRSRVALAKPSAVQAGGNSSAGRSRPQAAPAKPSGVQARGKSAAGRSRSRAASAKLPMKQAVGPSTVETAPVPNAQAASLAAPSADEQAASRCRAEADAQAGTGEAATAPGQANAAPAGAELEAPAEAEGPSAMPEVSAVAAMTSAAVKSSSRAKKVKGSKAASGKRKAKVAAAAMADGKAVLDTQAPQIASADAGSAQPAADAAAKPRAGAAEQTAGDFAGSSGAATVLGASAQGGNAFRGPRPGSRVGRAELAGLEMLDSAMLGAGRTSRSARNTAGTAPLVPATTVAMAPAAAAASAGASAAQQMAGKPAGGSQSRKRKAAAVDGPAPVMEAGEGPAEAEVAAAAAKAPARKGRKASGKAKGAKQGPAGNRSAGSAGVAAAEPAEAVAAQPAKRTKGGAAGSQQTADVEMTDCPPTEAAAAAATAAAPVEAAPAASVASQAAAAPAEGAAELRRGTRRRQQVVLLSPGGIQASLPAPAVRAAVPAAAAAQSLAAAAVAASDVAAAEPMQEGVLGLVPGVSKAGRLRKASAKASAAREVPLARQGSARGHGRTSAHPEKPRAEKAQAEKAPGAAQAAEAVEGSATITAPVLEAPLEQVVPQVSLQHAQAQPPVLPQAPSSPQGSRPAPSSPSRPSRSAAQAASRAITSQLVAESDDLGVKELAVNDVREPAFEASREFEAPSSPKRRGRPKGSGVEARTAQQLELERWVVEGSQLPCVRQRAQEVFEASNWPCNQEIKLQHLINSPAMHGVELYTGLIKKYGPEQVIKGKVGSDGKVVCGCALCNFGVSQCVSEFEKHGRSGANRPAQNVCLAALSEEADHEISLGMLMVAVNQQRELKSQACFKAGQEGATCEGPAEMHCVWCGVGAHAQCAALQPDKVPLWICATCQANGRKVSSLPKAVPRKKQAATGSASVKGAPKAGKKRAHEEEDETVLPNAAKPAKKKRKESSGWGRATLLDSRMYPNERVFFGLPGGLEDGERLYYRKTVSSDTILTGRASLRNASNPNSWGVICECRNCKGQAVIKPTKFENCAGNGSAKQPYQHIWVKRGGRLVVLKELSRMLPPLDTEDLQAAYHRASQAKSRSQNVEKVGGCVFCNSTHFTPSTEGRWDEQTAVLCSQCEREHHVGCLRKHRGIHLNEEPPGDWFCSEPCSHMFSQLKGLVTDAPMPIPTHLQPPDRPQYFMSFLNGLSGSHTTKLDVRAGQAVLTEAFASWRCAGFPAEQGEHAPYAATDIPVGGMDPVTSYHSDDLVVHDDGIVECTKKKEAGMVMKNMIMLMPEAASHGAFDFQGFYTLLLTKMEPETTAKGAPILGEDGQPRQRRVPLCTLTARFLGPRLVEVPFVATRLKSQRQGHCRILISVLEHMMQQVGVKHIVLPASKSTVATWQGGFGFQPCPEAMYRMYLKEYPILNFVADTVVMHKWTVGAEDADRKADEAAVKESKGKKGKGGRPPLASKAAGGSGGLGPSGPSLAAALNAAVATQQEHLQDAESNQDRQGSGSTSDQARGSDNALAPLPQEDSVEVADPVSLPATGGLAGSASTQVLSGLCPAPDPLLDSWGDAAPSGDSEKCSPDSSNVGDNEDCKTLRIRLPTAPVAGAR